MGLCGEDRLLTLTRTAVDKGESYRADVDRYVFQT
jgi:hypothetical protein